MHSTAERTRHTRREFLNTTASGLGMMALGAMLDKDGVLAPFRASGAESSSPDVINPLAPKAPHFAAKAKSCIFIFMAGAPSQLDLFDPKPKLNKIHGQKLPESFTKNVRFAFIQKETATVMGSKRKFTKHGQCGMELSDLLPHIGTVADDILLVRSLFSSQFNNPLRL